MTAKRILAAVAAGVVGTCTGCVTTCEHSAFLASLQENGGPTGIPAPVRQRVYLFMMNGAEIIESAGLCKLRDRVCEAGFSKVYIAQRMDANWYEREVRRVAYDDPSAKIILLGVGIAADKMIPLASGVVEDGVKLDALILLDPAGGCVVPASTPYRTLVVRGDSWIAGREVIAAENVVVKKAGHLSIANAPAVVDIVVKQMVASAEQVGALPPEPFPLTPLHDMPEPTPRGIDPATLIPQHGDWDFLHTPPTMTPLTIPVINAPPDGTLKGSKLPQMVGDRLPYPQLAAPETK